jgi:hypothetical protein
MIGHQAKAMDTVSEAFNSLLEEQVETGAILVVKENRLAIIATEDNVIQCSGIENSWFSSHEMMLSHNSQYCKPDPTVIGVCLLCKTPQSLYKVLSVLVVVYDPPLFNPSEDHMVKGSGSIKSRLAGRISPF